jgi:putative pyruvate formate lyase activating enzyme
MICELCPRRCGAERNENTGAGFCRMPAAPVIARAAKHYWEEPCISGESGSGAVFFSGCTLRCAFCQNMEISAGGFGRRVSAERLREIFEELIADGANNINLVSPTPYVPWILKALEKPLAAPVVWNTGGYERVGTLRALEGKVQIYLPDLKYVSPALSEKYSGAADYFEHASRAIREMFRQTGPYVIGDDGLMRSGVVIRHLMIPGELEETKRVIDWAAENFKSGDIKFSLMSQYTPRPDAKGSLARRVTGAEYRAACGYMRDCGIDDGFFQERRAAREEYTPPFDLTGVEKP